MSKVAEYLESNRQRHLDELFTLLRIPSVSTDPNHKDDVARAAEFVAERMRGAGLDNVEVHSTPGHPIVYGDWLKAGDDKPTVLVYGHYDVQPPDPLNLWNSGPFEPTVVDGQIVARGSSDDKGQVYCHIKGVEAHLANGGQLPVNVKFLVEGEEEIGSPNLAPFLRDKKDLLAADAVVISDSAMLGPGKPSITYGLRGLTYLQVEVEGPTRDLHSGMFGGGVENPIQALCTMIASLKDEKGRIQVEGFYDKVVELTPEERQAIADLPFDEEEWLKETGAPKLHGEEGYSTYERIGARPTIDLCGIWGGFTGEGAKTVLPSKAYAKISSRLVADQDPDEIAELIEAHLEKVAPDTIRVKVDLHHGGHAALIDTDLPAVQAAARALQRAFGGEAVFTREGGSIPIVADFQQILGLQSVLMGFGLSDDKIHSPNEKLDLDHYYKGIVASAYLFEELAG